MERKHKAVAIMGGGLGTLALGFYLPFANMTPTRPESPAVKRYHQVRHDFDKEISKVVGSVYNRDGRLPTLDEYNQSPGYRTLKEEYDRLKKSDEIARFLEERDNANHTALLGGGLAGFGTGVIGLGGLMYA